jgi:hypothetical protein
MCKTEGHGIRIASVVSIMDFMKKLLPAGYHQKLESMHPSVGDGTAEFHLAFADCRLWCNHLIQVQDCKVINTKFLCALLSNGIGHRLCSLRP